jgi:hypothetical protein
LSEAPAAFSSEGLLEFVVNHMTNIALLMGALAVLVVFASHGLL